MSNVVKVACQDCGSNKEVIDGICEDCAENYTYCNSCEEHISIGEALYYHRHVFESEHCEWIGSGGVDMNESYEGEIKTALFFVLTGIPAMADPLAHTIKVGKMDFDTIHLSIGLVLGPVTVCCYLIDSDGELRFFTDALNTLAHDILESENDEQIKQFEYAVRWLISLDDETKEANEMTLKWIEEWRKKNESISHL